MPSSPKLALYEHLKKDAIQTRLFGSFFWICAALALLPIWSVTYLPFVDLGGHIELMDIAAHLGQPEYEARFQLQSYLGPNTITLIIAALLGDWVDAVTLSRLMLSWYVVGLPIAFLYFCKTFGRSRWLAFFAFPITWNHMLNFGFLNFLVGLPLFFFVAGGLRKTFETSELNLKRLGLISGGLFVLYFCHFLVWLMALGYVFYLFVVFAKKSEWKALWIIVPSLLLGAVWAVSQHQSAASNDPAWDQTPQTRIKPLESMFLDFHYAGLRFLENSSDEFIVMLLLFASLLLLVWRDPPSTTGSIRQQIASVVVELSAVLTFWIYFALPENFGGVNVVAVRVLPIFFLFLAASHKIKPSDPRAALPIVLVVGAALVYPMILAKQFRRFDDKVIGGLPAALDALPDHAPLLYRDDSCADWNYSNPVIELCVNFHIPRAIHTHLNHGVTSLSFAGAPTSMIAWRAGQAIPHPGEDFWTSPPWPGPMYVLLRSEKPPEQALSAARVTLLYGENSWWLFQVN